jgi:heme-degrading monooxygenase HmoA
VQDWHIAQMNVATALYDMDDPRIAEFVARLDDVNALADRSPGFVWRLQSESGNATDIQATDDPRLIVNMSVWNSVEALFDFAYKSLHRQVVGKRREWFAPPKGAYQVLWWVAAGTQPSVQEGLDRLRRLDTQGPSAHAFTFKSKFPPPGTTGDSEDLNPEPYCVGWE